MKDDINFQDLVNVFVQYGTLEEFKKEGIFGRFRLTGDKVYLLDLCLLELEDQDFLYGVYLFEEGNFDQPIISYSFNKEWFKNIGEDVYDIIYDEEKFDLFLQQYKYWVYLYSQGILTLQEENEDEFIY